MTPQPTQDGHLTHTHTHTHTHTQLISELTCHKVIAQAQPVLLTDSETEHEAGTDDGATDNETDNESDDGRLHRFPGHVHVQFRREEQQQRGSVHLHARVV